MSRVNNEIKEHPLYDRALAISRTSNGYNSLIWCINFIDEWEKITKELRVHDRTGD